MTTLVLGTIHLKVGEKESIMSQSMQDREILSWGRNFNQGLGKPISWLKLLSLGWDHDGFLYSYFSLITRLDILLTNNLLKKCQDLFKALVYTMTFLNLKQLLLLVELNMSQEPMKSIKCHMQTVEAQSSLPIFAVWSVAQLLAKKIIMVVKSKHKRWQLWPDCANKHQKLCGLVG